MIGQNLKQSIDDSIGAGLSSLLVPEPLKLSEWADENFYLSAESSNVIGPWETLPYQKAPMNCISDDDIEVISIQKCTRVGYTKIICAAVGYFAEHKKRNQLIYQPTDTDAEDFVKDEIDTMIRDVPAVGNILKCNPEQKSSFNTLSKKGFLGSVLDIKGGKTPRNYRRMTKDVVYYDELDGFDPDISKEGSPTKLGDERISNSSFPKSIRGSTPKIKGKSLIEDSVNEADLLFYRYLHCPECGFEQKLEFKNLRWAKNKPKTAQFVCVDCGCLIDYSSYPAMDAAGKWKTLDGIYIDEDDFFRGPDHSIIDKPRHVAFFIWSAYSYYLTWGRLADEFVKADRKNKKDRDPTQLKTFTNTKLAETWEEDQGEQPDWTVLQARAEPYKPLTVPMGGLLLVAGVDTQNDRLAVVINAYGRGEESWRIYHSELFGDPAQDEVWNQLDEFLNATYEHASGADLHIACMAIDSGGQRTQAVYNYVRKRSPRVIAIKGSSQSGRPVLGKPTPQDVTWGGGTLKNGVKLWPVGTDTAKGILYSRMKLTEPGPGYFHTPIGFSEDYYKQVTSEKLVETMRKGHIIKEWIASGRNETLDCEVYAYAAAMREGLVKKNWDSVEEKIQEAATFKKNKISVKAKPDTTQRKTIKSTDPYM